MMQKNIQKKDSIVIRPGTVIVGKWNRNKYVVKRKLGAGMIGTVYLCQMNKRLVALKVSKQAMSLTAEVNVLKSLNKVQDKRLGPFLLDVDDFEAADGNTFSFYVMEYINGRSMESFVHQNGYEWLGVFLIQLLDQLEELHQSGWVFGDLKNDNLLIASSPPTIRFVDVGGTTKIGRSIKEYSEFYDRAYWHLGSREAEPSYDLFALVMVVLTVFYPKQFKRTDQSSQLIFQKIAAVSELKLFHSSFQKAITGKYKSAKEMKEELLQKMMKQQASYQRKQKQKSSYIIEALLITSISTVYYIISYFLF